MNMNRLSICSSSKLEGIIHKPRGHFSLRRFSFRRGRVFWWAYWGEGGGGRGRGVSIQLVCIRVLINRFYIDEIPWQVPTHFTVWSQFQWPRPSGSKGHDNYKQIWSNFWYSVCYFVAFFLTHLWASYLRRNEFQPETNWCKSIKSHNFTFVLSNGHIRRIVFRWSEEYGSSEHLLFFPPPPPPPIPPSPFYLFIYLFSSSFHLHPLSLIQPPSFYSSLVSPLSQDQLILQVFSCRGFFLHAEVI